MKLKSVPTPAVYLRTARRAVYKAKLLAAEVDDRELELELGAVLTRLESIRPKRVIRGGLSEIPHCPRM